MRIPQIGPLLCTALITLGLTSCGTSADSVPVSPVTPPPAQGPPTTLTGNWSLAGSRVPAVYPAISTSILVQGNQLSGRTAFSAQCALSGITGTVGATGFALDGTIGTDGTFQASSTTPANPMGGTFSLSLTGNSPLPATPSVWTGTYSLAFTPGTTGVSCSIAQTGNFTATPIVPLTGTYLGAAANFGGPFGPDALVSLQIVQGMPALVTRGTESSYQIPLTASLTIANSPCALSTSTTGASAPGSLYGDSFQISFPVPGSSGGILSGTLNDATAKTFLASLTTLAIANGCPSGLALYNFTRQ